MPGDQPPGAAAVRSDAEVAGRSLVVMSLIRGCLPDGWVRTREIFHHDDCAAHRRLCAALYGPLDRRLSGSGHWVTASLGHRVTGSRRHCVTASLRHRVTGVTGSRRHWVTASLRHWVTGSRRHCVTASPRHRVTASPRHRVTASPRHRVTELLGHCATAPLRHCATAPPISRSLTPPNRPAPSPRPSARSARPPVAVRQGRESFRTWPARPALILVPARRSRPSGLRWPPPRRQ